MDIQVYTIMPYRTVWHVLASLTFSVNTMTSTAVTAGRPGMLLLVICSFTSQNCPGGVWGSSREPSCREVRCDCGAHSTAK